MSIIKCHYRICFHTNIFRLLQFIILQIGYFQQNNITFISEKDILDGILVTSHEICNQLFVGHYLLAICICDVLIIILLFLLMLCSTNKYHCYTYCFSLCSKVSFHTHKQIEFSSSSHC